MDAEYYMREALAEARAADAAADKMCAIFVKLIESL